MLHCGNDAAKPRPLEPPVVEAARALSAPLVFSLELSRFVRMPVSPGMPHAFKPRMQPDPCTSTQPLPLELAPCDTARRFVRVLDERADGLVAFEFAIGWPELAVELLLPAQAFVEFCATQRAQRLDSPRCSH
jgi:phenol hydroxylase P0 protein